MGRVGAVVVSWGGGLGATRKKILVMSPVYQAKHYKLLEKGEI
jgi:hypothetical protein